MTDRAELPVNEIARITATQFIVDPCSVCGGVHRHGRVPRDLDVGEETARGAHCADVQLEYRLRRTRETEVEV